MIMHKKKYLAVLTVLMLFMQILLVVTPASATDPVDYTITRSGDNFLVNGAGSYATLAAVLAVCTEKGADDKLVIQLGDGDNSLEAHSCSDFAVDNQLIAATYTGKVNITIGSNAAASGLIIPSGITATFKDLTISNTSTSYGFKIINVLAGGTLDIEEGTSVTSSYSTVQNNAISNRGNLNIKGGTITGDNNT
jgi:hypothetical protein